MSHQKARPGSPPGLPPDLRAGFLTTLDLQFSGIFSVTSALTVLLVAYAESVPYAEAATLDTVPGSFQRLIMPERTQQPVREVKAAEPEPQRVAKPQPGANKPKPEPPRAGPAESSRARVARAGLIQILGSAGRGGAVRDVFDEGGLEETRLSQAFSGIRGVEAADREAAGTRGADAGHASIAGLDTSGAGALSRSDKRESLVGARLEAAVPDVEGPLSAETVHGALLDKLRGLKDCYERQLKRFPALAGKLTLSFEILETQRVGGVAFAEDSVQSSELRTCIQERARHWRFPNESGFTAWVRVPLIFAPAR